MRRDFYGISIQKIPRRIVDRIIIPRLAPTHIMSYVSLGMNRPEWIKFIVSAIAHKKLDLRNPADRYRLIFDESWGWLFQAFILKREAEDLGETSSGYGTGFLQIQSSGSLGILDETVSSDLLCSDVVNDLLSELEPGKIKKCIQVVNKCFRHEVDTAEAEKKFLDLMDKPPEEKMRGLFNIITWAINENLKHDYPTIEQRADLLTIPNQYLRIVQDMGVNQPTSLTQVLKALCSEPPGRIPKGLLNFEIACMFHEMLVSDHVKAIPLSFIVFDLARKKSPFLQLPEVDDIFRDAYSRLPHDEHIEEYIKTLYQRICQLLTKRLSSLVIAPFRNFKENCRLNEIKKTAVLWEYNLVAGELEEILRLFAEEPDSTPPYKVLFEKRWNALDAIKKDNLKRVISRFEFLASMVKNNDDYVMSFQTGDEFTKSLPSWFEHVTDGLSSWHDPKSKLEFLIRKAGEMGDSVEFDGKIIEVLKAPTAVNPLIARGAFYDWLRCFLGLWEK